MDLVLVSATGAAGFFRCGKFFPKTGKVLDASTLDVKVIERLKAEPSLRLSEPSEEQVQAFMASNQGLELDGKVALQIEGAIASLLPGDFTKNGVPKVGALKLILTDIKDEITAARVELVLADMLEAGFKVPTTAT